MKVAIIGASAKPDRYAYRAQELLMEKGHETFPVSLSGEPILGRPGFASIGAIPEEDRPVHTVTVYVRPERLAPIADEILQFLPQRMIFNPGTESSELAERFRQAGCHVIEACTLVLLNTGQFETA